MVKNKSFKRYFFKFVNFRFFCIIFSNRISVGFTYKNN